MRTLTISDQALIVPRTTPWLTEVQADSPTGLWLMQESSGTTITATTGNNGTYSATGRTAAVAGPGKAALPNAMQFNGTAGAGTIAHNFGSNKVITVCCWFYWDAYATDDDLLMEYTPNYNSNSGFIVDANPGGGLSGTLMANETETNNTRVRGGGFPRPTAAAWHHLAIVFDRTGSPSVTLYTDGVVRTRTVSADTGSWTGGGLDFTNSNLYLMSRNAASLFGAGRMCGLSLHNSALSAVRIAAHYAGT